MERLKKSHSFKYLIYLCAFFFFQSSIISNNETIIRILIQFPSNIIQWVLMLSNIVLMIIYFIHHILDYVNLENEIKIRLGNKYFSFIINKIFQSFVITLLLLLSYLLILNIPLTYIFHILFMNMLVFVIFVLSTFILKKDNYQFILIVNLIVIVICRYFYNLICF